MTKKVGISVPEGHLEALQQKLRSIPEAQNQTPAGVRKLAPYLAYAAMLAVLVVMGNAILRLSAGSAEDDSAWDYYSYLAQSLDPDGGLIELKEQEELTEDDIISYLIADNLSVEQLMASYYEEAY